jgi:hypothetical protein
MSQIIPDLLKDSPQSRSPRRALVMTFGHFNRALRLIPIARLVRWRPVGSPDRPGRARPLRGRKSGSPPGMQHGTRAAGFAARRTCFLAATLERIGSLSGGERGGESAGAAVRGPRRSRRRAAGPPSAGNAGRLERRRLIDELTAALVRNPPLWRALYPSARPARNTRRRRLLATS